LGSFRVFMLTPTTRVSRVIALLIAIAVVVPPHANAQRQTFVDHLITFRLFLFGPYGDEGKPIVETIDRLSASLSAWDESLRLQEQALRLEVANASGAEPSMALATLLADRGRLADALIEVDSALAAHPTRQLHSLRGGLLAQMGRDTEAAGAYLRAWELDGSDAVSAYLALALRTSAETDDSGPFHTIVDAQRLPVGSSRGKPMDELRLIPDRASKTPVFVPAAYADGFDAVAAGDYPRALRSFRAAAARDPLINDRALQSNEMSLGISRLRAGMMVEAIGPLESAAAINVHSSEAHRVLGTAYGAIDNDSLAVRHLRRAVSLAPDDERSRLALARVLRDARRLDEAADSLRETLVQIPRSTEARWMLANIMEGLGADAAGEWQAAADLPVIAGKADLYRRAAEVCDRHQQVDCVVELLRRRVRLDPNDASAHRQLGLVLSRLGHTELGFAELAMADLLGGADAESLAAIGQLHLEAGRFPEAERATRRAIALQGDRHDARYVLGQTLLRQGRMAEAREQLEVFRQLRNRAMEVQRRSFEANAQRPPAPD
jgi:tetratricopeptide (TPR) repeat protein